MRGLSPDQLLAAAGLIVTLLIFFSIDAKFRFRPSARRAREIFHTTSIVGGISCAIAFVVIWINVFIPDDMEPINLLTYFIPSSVAIACALLLSIEVIFLRRDSEDDDD